MMDDAHSALDKHRPGQALHPRTWNIKTYTDNFLLETRLQRGGRDDLLNAFRAVAALQYTFVRRGFISRGAMSIGYNYTADKVVFGSALVEAHDLESKVANVPRTILANSVRRLTANHFRHQVHGEGVQGNAMPLLEDFDGQWFVSYLSETLVEDGRGRWWLDPTLLRFHRDLIATNLENHSHSVQIRAKYIWAAGYHNWFVSRYRRRGQNNLLIKISDAIRPAAPMKLPLKSLDRMERSFNRRINPDDDIARHAVRIAARQLPMASEKNAQS
jgi:hypothetical protein